MGENLPPPQPPLNRVLFAGVGEDVHTFADWKCSVSLCQEGERKKEIRGMDWASPS